MKENPGTLRARVLAELRAIRGKVAALEQLLERAPRSSSPSRRRPRVMDDSRASDARFLGVSRRTLETGGRPWSPPPASTFPTPCAACLHVCGPNCPCSCHSQAVES